MEQVVMYRCKHTGNVFDTRQKALSSERRFKAKEKKRLEEQQQQAVFQEQRSWIANNARHPSEAVNMLVNKSLEFWGISLTVTGRFSTNSSRGDSLSGQFKISGSIVDKDKCKLVYNPSGHFNSISDVLFRKGFIGFKSGSGCPGIFDQYSFRMDLRLMLDSFPLIKENYERYKAEKKKQTIYITEKEKALLLSKTIARKTKEYSEITSHILELRVVLNKLQDSLSEVEHYHSRKFMELWHKANPSNLDLDLLGSF
jgi:hypothetical protein